jgi:hypothetical protein
MNRRHLSLGPIATKQLRVALGDIPLRPAAPVAVDAPVLAEAQAEAAMPTIPVSAIAPVLQEKPTEATELVKPAPAKAAVKPILPRRPRSLDELIAQVAAGR